MPHAEWKIKRRMGERAVVESRMLEMAYILQNKERVTCAQNGDEDRDGTMPHAEWEIKRRMGERTVVDSSMLQMA
jgi:hypothetical protein